MKLSAILAPLIAAKVPHEVILETVRAYEAQQENALEKRRVADRQRQARKRNNDSGSRDVTLRHGDRLLATRAEDSSSNKQISGQEEKKEDTSPTSRSKRGERIPDDFRPDIDAAIAEGLPKPEAERQARSFCDYWRAKPGKDGLKLDWPATWRVWFRRNIPSQPHPQRQSMAPPQRRERSVSDVFSEIAAGTWTGPQGNDHEPDQPFIETSFSRRN